ncbi:MAG: ComF family protein [Gammaproteobacteria bacterium]|nr:ComF family protein [Gammaproteobacteria bacterium]
MILEQIKRFSNQISHWLPESDCLLCYAPISPNAKSSILCHQCIERLPMLSNGCKVCAMPISDIHSQESDRVCGECLSHAPFYHQTISSFHYESPVSHLIGGIKFNSKFQFIPLLTQHLVERIATSYKDKNYPDVILPVPLHKTKLKKRGFNQSQLIANYLAIQLKEKYELSIPVDIKLAKRVRNTLPQTTLDAKARKKNLRNAFSIESSLPKTIALVDDVITTGTTVNELSKQLIKSGCQEVHIWTLARAFSI